METFEYRGLPIKYVRAGKGEPLVFIHNGGTSHTIWRDVIPHFTDRYETFALDLLGFGGSAKPETGYDFDNYVGLLTGFIDTLGLKGVRLVGNCMGSAMSIGYARQRPKDVKALVLINPLTDATFSAGWLGSALWLHKNAPALANGVFSPLKSIRLPHAISEQSLAFQFGSIGRKRKLYKTPELCDCFSGEGWSYSLLTILSDLANYAAIDSFVPGPDFPPICTIWGLENRMLSAKAGRKLNETLRPAREAWLEGCGHICMLEKPDEIASIISEFFGERRAAVA